MLKLVFIFGLIVASAVDEDTSHNDLSRHAELRKPSNQIVKETFAKTKIDSLNTQQRTTNQRTQAGKDPFTWFWKWSLTNYPCSYSNNKQPVKQMRGLSENEDLAMSVSISVQRKGGRNQSKVEKMVEVETSHPREKREATIPESDLKLSLLHDWTENKVKVSHISHIYIGESLYPYIYEESRVLQSEPPKPSSGENPRLKEVKISDTRHKQEEEVTVHEITKIYEIK